MWNYWRVKYLAIRFKNAIGKILLVFFSTVWKEPHAYKLNGVHLIWRFT